MMIVTNKASSVYAAIERIAATPSKLEKEALVKLALESSPLFKKVVLAAYNPRVTYGIAVVPKKTEGTAPGGNTLDEDWPWDIVAKLASRQLTGGAARAEVQRAVDFLDEGSSELFRRIVLKDMRAGFTDGTINRVMPGSLPEFPYMRCSLPDKSNMPKWDWSAGYISQEKADGMFVNVNVTAEGAISVHSRQGSLFPLDRMGGLEAAIGEVLNPGTQTHGELVVYQGEKVLAREIGNGMLNSVQQGGQLEDGLRIVLFVWDQIPLGVAMPKGKHAMPYEARLTLLLGQLRALRSDHAVRLIPTRVVRTKEAAYAHYRELLKEGKEGTIVKSRDAIWKDGTSKDQVKLKLEVDFELKIVGFVPGTPGTKTEATFGSLLCRSECGQLEVAVSGLTDAARQRIHADREGYLGKIITSRGNSIMAPSEPGALHSIFLPRLIEERNDKAVADTLEQIQAIFAAAMGLEKEAA